MSYEHFRRFRRLINLDRFHNGNNHAEQRASDPSIRGLAELRYQPESLRLDTFCNRVIERPEEYFQYLTNYVLPFFRSYPDATRVVDRVIVRHGLEIPPDMLEHQPTTEAVIPLGGRWEGYDWMINGLNLPNRQLPVTTKVDWISLAAEAKKFLYQLPKPIEPELRLEQVGAVSGTPDTLSLVVRNAEGAIVATIEGRGSMVQLDQGLFCTFRIGEPIISPSYQTNALYRYIKHALLSQAVKAGYDCITAEPRADQRLSNIDYAKNGMTHQGILWQHATTPDKMEHTQTADSEPSRGPSDRSMEMISVHLWTLTPKSLLWDLYLEDEEHQDPT